MSILSKVANLEGHEHPIYALCISQKSHILFSGGGEGAVVEWSLKNMAPIKVMYKTRASIYALHCPTSLPLLISGDRLGQISVFNFIEQKLVFQKQLTTQPIFGLYSIEHLLYFTSEDGKLRVFDLEKLEIVSEISISDQALRSITYDGTDTIYLGSKDNRIYHYSIKNERVIKSDEEHTLPVFSLCYDSKKNRLLSGSRDAQLKVWSDGIAHNIPAHLYAINSIVNIPDKGLYVTASMDKSIKAWDADTLDLLAIGDSNRNEGHLKSVNALAYTSFENYLISAGDDRMIMVWNLAKN